jgi:hypothetical protein
VSGFWPVGILSFGILDGTPICDVKILLGWYPSICFGTSYLEPNHSDLDLEKLRKILDHAIGLFSKDDFCEFTASFQS